MKIICFVLIYLSTFRNINFTNYNILEIGTLLLPVELLYILFRKKKKIFKMMIKYYLFCIIFLSIHFITKLINNDLNLFSGVFINFVFRIFSNFISAVVIIDILNRIKERKKEKLLLKLYVYVVALDLFSGVLMRVYPDIIPFFIKLNKNLSLEIFSHFGGYRIICFGAKFFSTGVIASTALIVLIYVLKKENTLKNWLLYFWIAIIGLFSARTTLIGIGISIVYFLRYNLFKLGKYIWKIIILFIIVMLGIKKFDEKILNWAFQLFINGGETTSTNRLKEMWHVIPTNIKTWIVGDGKWNLVDGYYMSTDVGYLRILWYSGLVGIFIFVLFSIFLFLEIRRKELRIMSCLLLLLFLILNVKGHVEPFFILYCLIILETRNAKRRKNIGSKCCNVCL